MLIIGLTGGIGSGKTTVARLFSQLDINIIDADEIARNVVTLDTKALSQIVGRFGKDILQTNGELDRKKLRKIIFNSAHDRIWLEELLHPLIRAEMRAEVEKVTSPYCILVIPLLVESKKNDLVQRVLVVDAPEELQIERAVARDGLTPEQAMAILQSQAPRAQRLAAADDIIHNDTDLTELNYQVMLLHEKYMGMV